MYKEEEPRLIRLGEKVDKSAYMKFARLSLEYIKFHSGQRLLGRKKRLRN